MSIFHTWGLFVTSIFLGSDLGTVLTLGLKLNFPNMEVLSSQREDRCCKMFNTGADFSISPTVCIP